MNWPIIGVVLLGAFAQLAAGTTCQAGDAHGNVVSPDGAVVAIGGDDGSLQLWLRAAPEESLSLFEPLDGERLSRSALSWRPRVAFSADGDHLAAVRGEEPVAIWSLADAKPAADAKPLATLRHDGVVASMKFSPDGETLVTIAHLQKGSGTNLLTLWNLPAGTRRAALRLDEQCEFADVSFSRDGKTLCMPLTDRAPTRTHLIAWQLDTGKATLYALPAGSGKVEAGGSRLAPPREFTFSSWGYNPLDDLGDAPAAADEPPRVHLLEEPR